MVVEEPDEVAAFADFTAPEESQSSPEGAPTTQAPVDDTLATPVATTTGTPSLLLPSARHLSESKGFDATLLQGSGKGGHVTKGDVMTALEAGTIPPLSAKTTVAAAAAPTTMTAAAPVAAAAAATPSPTFVPVGDLALPTPDTLGSFEDLPNNKMRKIIASRLTE